ncbi:MAG: nuclear transport factor 2 family protein [Myxococcota bacterium]|nr:nuclear transport factor 2 family protein [Myxococcota bacterium]
MRILTLILSLTACGSGPKTPESAAPNAELSSALTPLAWWLGDWKAKTGTEHWVAASGAIYGIALKDNAQFEVMIIDDGDGGGPADGKLRLFAMPGGMKFVEFGNPDVKDTTAAFSNPAHDYPKTITYARDGKHLVATIGGDGKAETFRFVRRPRPRAPALEAADIAFAKDTAARGIEGWVAAFEPKGGIMSKAGRVEGMSELAPTKVEWAPIASAVRGDIGYTVGKATFTGKDSWRSTYVSIWKKQPDGTWKVLFDTGRTINAE